MRISGALQGAVLSLIVGWGLPRLAGPEADGSGFPFVLGFLALTYATLAVIVPWLAGVYQELELSPAFTGVLTVLVGSAFGISGAWIAGTPFRKLAWFHLIVMTFLLLLFLFSVGRWAIRRDMARKSKA